MPTADSLAATAKKTATSSLLPKTTASVVPSSVASPAANAARSSAAQSSRMQAQADAYAAQQAKIKSDAAAKAKADKARADALAKSKIATKTTTPTLTSSGTVTKPVLFDKDQEATPKAVVVVTVNDTNGAGGGTTTNSAAVKVATPDIITIDQETLPAELMTSLIFENIGGQELINISRHDLVSGSNMDFQSIKNLNEIYLNHNSLNIIPMPDSATVYEKNFPISWSSHIVEEFSSADSTHIFIDSVAKELQVLVANIKPGEQVEVEVLSSISEYNYTHGSYPESF